MRLDRSVTLVLARLRGQPDGGQNKRVLPILMYHSISDDAEPGTHPYFQVNTAPGVFRQQIELLQRLGYRGVSLEDGLDWLQGRPAEGSDSRGVGRAQRAEGRGQRAEGRGQRDEVSRKKPTPQLPTPSSQLPAARLVAITFDDGYQDFLTEGVPVLEQHGFRATMYVATDYVGGTFKNRACLSWEEIRDLRQRGFRFGSHTASHPKLHASAWDDIETELHDSRAALEDQLGEPVVSFAYPYAYPQADAEFCARFEGLLERLGYRSDVTTMIGLAQPGVSRFRLPRLPVNGADDAALLSAKLNGAYNWLGWLQGTSKKLRFRRAATPGPGRP